jgi:prevent-host-death family protein
MVGRGGVKTVTAAEVAQNFSEVLDGVEHRHQTYVVTRRGRPIARITPVPSANGLDVKRVLRDHAADPSWPEELVTLRGSVTVEERD